MPPLLARRSGTRKIRRFSGCYGTVPRRRRRREREPFRQLGLGRRQRQYDEGAREHIASAPVNAEAHSTFVDGRNARLAICISRYAPFPIVSSQPLRFSPFPTYALFVSLSLSFLLSSLYLSFSFSLFLCLFLSAFLYASQYARVPIYRCIASDTTFMCVASDPIVDDT